MSDDCPLPAVTCLCPTYGRFARLREALACFLAQDYPNKRLLILNDAPEPLFLSHTTPHGSAYGPEWEDQGLHIINAEPNTFANLGEKRQVLLVAAQTPLVAHWDDDDLYLPWHLSRAVAALLARDVGCVKARGAWYLTGPRDALECQGVHHNVFEGTMVFRRQEALDLGGYPPKHSGQAKALMDAFERAGRLYKISDDGNDDPRRFPAVVSTQDGKPSAEQCQVSYAYRWHDGVGHISGIGNKPGALQRFEAQNRDFGNGQPLTPGDLEPYWEALAPARPTDNVAVSEEADA